MSFEALRPKCSRLKPLQGIKRLFSLKSIIEAFKGVLKIAILLFLIYRFVEGALLKFAQYMNMDLARSIQSMLELGLGLLLEVAAAFLVISFFDYLYQWWEFERQLKMSKQEIKAVSYTHLSQGSPDKANDPTVDRFLASNRAATVTVYLQNKNVVEADKLVSVCLLYTS